MDPEHIYICRMCLVVVFLWYTNVNCFAKESAQEVHVRDAV